MALKFRIFDFLKGNQTKQGIEYFDIKIATQLSYKILAVHVAASYIANAISKCDIKIYRKKEEIKDNNAYRLNIEPNQNQNGSQFWNKVAMKMLTNQDGALVIKSGDKLYAADSFHVDKRPFLGNLYSSIVIDNLSLSKEYAESEVLHFQLEDENVINLIDAMYADYGKAISYAVNSFLKVNSQKYKLKVETDKIGDLKFEDYYKQYLEASMKSFIESDNGVYPESKGTNLESMKTELSTKDSSDLINLRNDMFLIAGQAYKIPASMMTGNINNIQDVVKAFITFAVEPVAKLIADEINRKFYGYEGYTSDTYVKVDTRTINYLSIVECAQVAQTLIGNTICNPGEVRELIGLGPINEEFMKQFFVTKNNSKVEDVMNGIIDGGGDG